MNVENRVLPSFLIAAGIHAGCLVGTGMFFVKPVQFGVDPGLSGIEVQLVAAAQEPIKQPTPIQQEISKEAIEIPQPLPEPVLKQEVKQENVDKGNNEETLTSKGGALMQAEPDYLSNPAPAYPNESRRLGQAGLVVLSVDVDREGSAVHIEIKQSTGYPNLDNAAIKAVRRWKFSPAKIGQLAVDSKVEVPIRFQLEK